MKRKTSIVFSVLFIGLFAMTTWAASSKNAVMSSSTYVANAELVRNLSSGVVTASTAIVKGDMITSVLMWVDDKTYGSVTRNPIQARNYVQVSYAPPYAVEDTIGAGSGHGVITLEGAWVARAKLSIP